MREIIFRVYDRVCKKMHIVGSDQHDYLDIDEEGVVAYGNYQNGDGSRCVEECVAKGKNEGYFLMQFTGLLDKNEKKIFEGDIVKYNSWIFEGTDSRTGTGTGIGTVYFNLGCFRVSAPSWEDDCALIDCEVIGNIHENPELLEVST
jgi:uncharacterized phage protein (TIGR01671 family)